MTANQINYAKFQEEKRHNLEQEKVAKQEATTAAKKQAAEERLSDTRVRTEAYNTASNVAANVTKAFQSALANATGLGDSGLVKSIVSIFA